MILINFPPRSDSVFMFPPFLAYYAGSTRNNTLLNLTVRQLELYRAGLRTEAGTWAHIAGGNSDIGHWSSRNGWAAMGMARVTFGETSGTSLLAAVVYRMAVISPATFGHRYISWAKTSLNAISRRIGSNGVISPAVNPYNYRSNTPYTAGSPEGQAWALMLYAAHRDCIASGICQP